MSKENFNLNTYILLGGFLIQFLSVAGYHFKAISDIREEIQTAAFIQSEKLRQEAGKIRDESRELFTSKEEAKFIQAALIEIKIDIKEIKAEQQRLRKN